VAEQLDIGEAHPLRGARGKGAQNTDDGAEEQSHDPGADARHHRPDQPPQEHIEIGALALWWRLAQNPPVPMVAHPAPRQTTPITAMPTTMSRRHRSRNNARCSIFGRIAAVAGVLVGLLELRAHGRVEVQAPGRDRALEPLGVDLVDLATLVEAGG